jgi:hypothetical protein
MGIWNIQYQSNTGLFQSNQLIIIKIILVDQFKW